MNLFDIDFETMFYLAGGKRAERNKYLENLIMTAEPAAKRMKPNKNAFAALAEEEEEQDAGRSRGASAASMASSAPPDVDA